MAKKRPPPKSVRNADKAITAIKEFIQAQLAPLGHSDYEEVVEHIGADMEILWEGVLSDRSARGDCD